MKTLTISDLKYNMPTYFSKENKRFFGDVSYKVLHGKQSHQPYLVTLTAMWSDMFGQPKKFVYRVKPVITSEEHPNTFKLGNLVDDIFPDMNAVKNWLASH